MGKIKIIGTIILCAIYTSCSTDDDQIQLFGIYTETSPFYGTHELHFVDNNTLILKAKNATVEKFNYVMGNEKIILSPIRDLSQSWEVDFKLINKRKFEIANFFYASIPEDDDAVEYVIFEREH